MNRAAQLLSTLRDQREQMVGFLTELAGVESPSTDPAATRRALVLLGEAMESLGYRTVLLPGRETGGHLYARPAGRVRGRPVQLLVGHMDTVWPLQTLDKMPIIRGGGRLRGPGTFDMKAGLTQMVFALRAVRDLHLEAPATPVVFVNSDEEIGSPESTRWIRCLAAVAVRAFVLEPALGAEGALKTARKGIGRFTLTAHGKAAHAGLDPEAGASAILEIARQVPKLFALNDPSRGITVNVGTIEGGLRPNVVAARSQAVVDVRVPTREDAAQITAAIHGLQAVTPGVRLEISGRIGRPPMTPTPASQALWHQARFAADALGFPLEARAVGGASDGNTTSQFTPTLDGLGAVGEGAHALHENVVLDRMAERAALLALLLCAPEGLGS